MERNSSTECDEPQMNPHHSMGMPNVVKCEFQRKEKTVNTASSNRKPSLFALEMDRIGLKSLTRRTSDNLHSSFERRERRENIPAGNLVIGSGITDIFPTEERKRIHIENLERMSQMSEEEIQIARQHILDTVNPDIVDFVAGMPRTAGKSSSKNESTVSNFSSSEMQSSHKSITAKSEQKIENAKLAWIKEVEVKSHSSTQLTQARFDFNGEVIPVNEDIPVEMGLHHHGNEPERPGYTVAELYILARSANTQQRQLAFRTLGRIVKVARLWGHVNALQTNVLRSLCDSGYPFLLRWGLDDSVEAVSLSALSALSDLACETDFESLWLDCFYHFSNNSIQWMGMKPINKRERRNNSLQSSIPTQDPGNEDPPLTDFQVMDKDLILGLLNTNILNRLSFIMKRVLCRLQKGIDDTSLIEILRLLTSISRHSRQSAYTVAEHPVINLLLSHCLNVTNLSRQDRTVPEFVPMFIRLLRIFCSSADFLYEKYIHPHSVLEKIFSCIRVFPDDVCLRVECIRLLTAIVIQRKGLRIIKSEIELLHSTMRKDYKDFYEEKELFADSQMSWVLCAWLTFLGACLQYSNTISEINWLTKALTTALDIVFEELKRFHTFCLKMYPINVLGCALNFMVTYQNSVEKTLDEENEMYNFCKQFCKNFRGAFIECVESRSFDILLRGLRRHSFVVLPQNTFVESLLPESISSPHFIMYQRLSDGLTKRLSPLEYCGWPVEALSAFLKNVKLLVMERTTESHKLGMDVLTQQNLTLYLRDFLIHSHRGRTFSGSFIIRAEVTLLTNTLLLASSLNDSSSEVPNFSVDLYHNVALRIMSHFHSVMKDSASQVLSEIIFNQRFMSLSNLHLSTQSPSHPRSIFDKHNDMSQFLIGDLLSDIKENLQSISSIYIGMLESSETDDDSPGDVLMPCHWPFQFILQIYHKLKQREISKMKSSKNEDENDPATKLRLLQSLQWVCYLELITRFRNDKLQKQAANALELSFGEKIVYTICFLLCSNDLFLENETKRCLSQLMMFYTMALKTTPQNLEDDLEKAAKTICSSFYDLYIELLKHYFSVSYGSTLFGNFVLIPTIASFSLRYRRVFWSDFSDQLRSFTMTTNEALIPLEQFLHESEIHLELLQLQAQALFTEKVSQQRTPLLYLIAIHSLNRGLFHHARMDCHLGKFQKLLAECVIAPEYSSYVFCRHILLYKNVDHKQAGGLNFYENGKIPETRRKYLRSLVGDKADDL